MNPKYGTTIESVRFFKRTDNVHNDGSRPGTFMKDKRWHDAVIKIVPWNKTTPLAETI